jgi:hypothetical protein
MVFSSLPTEEALKWQSQMALQSALCYEGKNLYDAYRHIPTAYIFCSEDKILTPGFQLERIEFLKRACLEGGRSLQVLEMKADHCPNVSALDETAEKIVQAIEK